MEKNFKDILNTAKSVTLSDDEKDTTRTHLQKLMEYHPVRNSGAERHKGHRSKIISPIYSFMFKPVPILITIALFLSGITGVAASALPGDALYPVKIASENAVTALTFTTERKAERNIILTERRLKEAETLIVQGKFTAPIAATLQEKVENSANAVTDNLNKLAVENKFDKAIRISSDFEVTLNAHETVSGRIAEKMQSYTLDPSDSSGSLVTSWVEIVKGQKDVATEMRVNVTSLSSVQSEATLLKLVEDLNANRATQNETKVKEVETSMSTTPPVLVEHGDVFINKMYKTAGTIGTKVTLSGYGFKPLNSRAAKGEVVETYVSFGGGYVKATVLDSRTITFIVPEGIAPACAFVVKKNEPMCMVAVRQTTPGKYAVKVVTPSGESNAVTFNVLMQDEGDDTIGIAISNLSPSRGVVGTVVTVSGLGFIKGDTTVTFGGGYVSNVDVVSWNELKFIVPGSIDICPRMTSPGRVQCMAPSIETQAQAYSVVVRTSNGVSNSLNFEVVK